MSEGRPNDVPSQDPTTPTPGTEGTPIDVQ